MDNLTVNFNLTTFWEDYNISLNVTGVHAAVDNFDLELDGVNDFMYVAVRFIDKWLVLLSGRFKQVIEQKIEQLVPLINRVLDYIPNRITIPGTSLHVDLGFSSNIECKDQSHLTLPLSITLQSDATPFLEPNIPNFPPYSN